MTAYRQMPEDISGMPKGVPYIVGNELAERFSYYGMKTILVVFMTHHLKNAAGDTAPLGPEEAKAWYHAFSASAYFFPILGAILSDAFLGKYRTIMALSLVYCLGHFALAIDETRLGLTVGLALIAVGSGGIKPCVSAHVGDQFGASNQHLLERVFGWFYFSINFGSFFSTLLTPVLLEKYGPRVAFGLPGVFMALATIVFWLGRNHFAHIPPAGAGFVKEIASKTGLVLLARVIGLVLFIAMFWALYDQNGSAWVLQAERMDLEFLGVTWLPSQVQAINPILVLILIPLTSYVIYPQVSRIWELTPLRKIGIGFALTVLTFVISAHIETRLDAGEKVNIGWQLFAFLVLTTAEVLVYGTGLEFFYAQAPNRLKSLVMALFLFSVSLGNLFTSLVNVWIQNPDGTSKLSGADYYLFFAGLMAATTLLYVFYAMMYRGQRYVQGMEPARAATPADARRRLLLSAAEAALADDPDPDTHAETLALIARAAADPAGAAELEDRFGSTLAFGTAGLRGLLGAGDNRMNRRVVARTTAGVCAYLARTVPDAKRRGLCLGFDGRHGSRAFAREVAEVAWGAGFVVHAFDDVIPTPVLAFSVLDRAAAGGVVITASHNPPAYNGYKVYLEDGAQLAAPHDTGIQREIDRVGSILALPRLGREEAEARGLAQPLDGVIERYVTAVAAAVGRAPAPLRLRAVYTPLHGVGAAVARRVFARIGAADVHEVAEQAEPDPDFPTVAFPNPEEPGALDRLLARGEALGASIAIANDPDADRLAVAARGRSGALAALSGNELGVLLADHLLARAPADGRNLVVTSIVSTPLLERIAAARGARCERTLTGFKWILGRALELERSEGLRLVLGFEEALGYCIGGVVRDKDGISAAAHALHLAELEAERGRSLHGALEALYRTHGLCESSQRSFTRPGPAGLHDIAEGMAKLRRDPPRTLAGLAVREVRDLISGSGGLPPSDVVVLVLEGDHRITVRPSGTEPKLKIYLDVWLPLAPDAPLAGAREQARALGLRLADAVADQLDFRRKS